MKWRKKLAIALLGLAALVSIVGGCGSNASSEARLTKKQYQTQANTLCQRIDNVQYNRASAYMKENPESTEEELVETAGIPPLVEELRQLETLPAPAADTRALKTLTESFADGLNGVQEDPKLVVTQEKNPFKKFNRLAGQYGLDACTSTP